MSHYNTLNLKLSNSQLNKLKSGIKNGTEVTLTVSSNLIGSSNDKTNFPHKILLIDTKVSKIRKVFANVSSTNWKFPKTHLSRMMHSGGYVGMSNPINTINPIKVLFKIANKGEDLSKKVKLNDIIKTVDICKSFLKYFKKMSGGRITLTNNKIKDMKVITPLENKGITLKGTTTKITTQERGFTNLLTPLMTAGLPLMKNVLILLAKNVLLHLGLSRVMSATDAAI